MISMKSSTMGHLLRASLLASLLLPEVKAQPLRNGAAPEQDRNLQYGIAPIEAITCRISAIDAQFEDGTEEKIYACTLNDDQSTLGGLMYSIDLSEDFASTNSDCIMTGHCYVDIQGGTINEDGDVPTIEIPEAAEMSVVDRSESEPDPTERRRLQTQYNPVLVVRVTGKDQSCDPSASDLAGSIFGIGNNWMTNNMKVQYERCSQGQQSFTPVTGNDVYNGVVDVYINQKIDGTDIFSLQNYMFKAADAAVGSSLSASPRHIMYIVPYGTTFRGSQGWVAFAHVSGNNSWYNDAWGNRLSAQVHEVGHNLGRQHANENGSPYNDQTGMMGYSYRETNGPLMCFNAFNHHSFGWYSSRTEYVDVSNGAWTGEMVAFVDAPNAISKPVIVNIDTFYMQLNSVKSFNWGTKEYKNQVVVIKGTAADVDSDSLGGLASPGNKISLNGNIVVELCSIIVGSSIDTARVSIYNKSNQSSGCNVPSPTPAPPSPTPAPPTATPESNNSINSSIGITRFMIVDTQTNAEIASNCPSCLGNASGLGIVAVTWGSVNCVEFKLTGQKTHTQRENVAPFSLFGDSGPNSIRSGGLQPGSYKLSATAYPQPNRKGTPSAEVVLNFAIA